VQIILNNVDDTEAFGRLLLSALPKKCLVFLNGQLGAGKTSLVRGMLRAAGYEATVRSPTYSLVEEYKLSEQSIYHFDLYRLKDAEELEWMGMSDYLNDNALCLIEWPEMGEGFLPTADVEISLNVVEEGRRLEIKALNPQLKNTLEVLFKNNNILL
jgi:tRNA threonylcarbamoyladenosine biosynthesis protein TsaE